MKTIRINVPLVIVTEDTVEDIETLVTETVEQINEIISFEMEDAYIDDSEGFDVGTADIEEDFDEDSDDLDDE